MNLHLLEHLVDCVINWGPLWSYTCFVFETMNCHIKKLFHGTKDMTKQVHVHGFILTQSHVHVYEWKRGERLYNAMHRAYVLTCQELSHIEVCRWHIEFKYLHVLMKLANPWHVRTWPMHRVVYSRSPPFIRSYMNQICYVWLYVWLQMAFSFVAMQSLCSLPPMLDPAPRVSSLINKLFAVGNKRWVHVLTCK